MIRIDDYVGEQVRFMIVVVMEQPLRMKMLVIINWPKESRHMIIIFVLQQSRVKFSGDVCENKHGIIDCRLHFLIHNQNSMQICHMMVMVITRTKSDL